MQDEVKMPAPIPTTGDISVHLSYIRRDIDEIKHLQSQQATDMKRQFDELRGAYVSRSEFIELSTDVTKTVDDHESRLRTLEKLSDNIMGKLFVGIAVFSFLMTIISAVIIGFIKKGLGL